MVLGDSDVHSCHPCQQEIEVRFEKSDNTPTEAELTDALEEPVIRGGAIITHLMNRRLYADRIKAVHDLLVEINPAYPGEVMDVMSVAELLMNRARIDLEEVNILKTLMFDEGGTIHTNIVATEKSFTLRFSYAFKRMAKTYEVRFSNSTGCYGGVGISMLTIPLDVRLVAWGNMDNRLNHDEECLLNLEGYNDCVCEPVVLNDVEMQMKDGSAESKEEVRRWIARQIFVGEPNE